MRLNSDPARTGVRTLEIPACDVDRLTGPATEVRRVLRASRQGRRRAGDVVGVAAEVQRLGLAIERVQQR